MQREIKYKFWLPSIRKMTYTHTLEDILSICDFGYGKNMIHLQYTGIPDNKGTEMCEGDLIKVTGIVSEEIILPLVWDKENARFDLLWPKEYSAYCFLDGGIEHYEVVGNIYQNSSLFNPQNGE